MGKIHIYSGDIFPEAFNGIRAEISFLGKESGSGIPNVKIYDSSEARKGLEQLKRWVSTGAFKVVVLSGFGEALEKGNKAHLLEWIIDHSTEPGFPELVLILDGSDSIDGLKTDVIDVEGVKRIATT